MIAFKPVGDLTLNEGHALFGNVVNAFVFGDNADAVRDLANPGTVINCAAPFIDDPDLGRCVEITDETDTLTVGGNPLTIPVTNGVATQVVVCKVIGSINSQPDWKIFYYQTGSERWDIEMYAHRYLDIRSEWGNGGNVFFDMPDLASDAELNNLRGLGISLNLPAGGSHAASDGEDGPVASPVSSADSGTAAKTIDVEVLPADQLVGAENTYRVAALLNFSVALSPADLALVLSDPYTLFVGDPVFNITNTSNSNPLPGDQVVFTFENATGPFTANLEGQTLAIDAQDANSATIVWPDMRTFGDRSLIFGSVIEIQFEDSSNSADVANIVPQAPGYQVTINSPVNENYSLIYDVDFPASNGDLYHAEWISGGNGITDFPASGDTDEMDLTLGDHVVRVYIYQDYGDGYSTWSTFADIVLSGGSPGLSLDSVSVDADGDQAVLIFSEAVSYSDADLALNMTLGTVNGTYLSGDNSSILVFSLDRVVKSNESGTAAITIPVDGIEAVDDGEDVETMLAVSIVNQSVVAPVSPTITVQPQNQSVVDGSLATFSVVASGAASYQWEANGVDIGGATSHTYQVTGNVDTNNGTVFRCRCISSELGETLSDPATLTVTAANTRIVTDQFVNRSVVPNVVMAGATVNYRVRNSAGEIVASGSLTTDLSGYGQADSSQFGAVGEVVYFEKLNAGGDYAGYPVTLVAAS